MTPRRYQELVRMACANRPLRGLPAREQAAFRCHWQTRVQRWDERHWQVLVAPGAVLDKPAAIPYKARGDARGWELTPEYPGYQRLLKGVGEVAKIRAVDRKLTERPAPFLLAQTPQGKDLGDFERVSDTVRPPAFRSAADWQLELWQTRLILGASQIPGTVNRNFVLPALTGRFRLGLVPRIPSFSGSVGSAAVQELARLYLLRDPAHPEKERLEVQQRCFWSLWTLNIAAFADFGIFGPEIAAFLSQANTGLSGVEMWTA